MIPQNNRDGCERETFQRPGDAGSPSPLKTASPVPVKMDGASSYAYRR
eukprot:COSAG02_NODE_39974_length_410_cov_1.250804_1_plen_47_part_10